MYEQCQARFRLQAREKVVPQRVNWRGCRARRTGQHRSARIAPKPARGDSSEIALTEANAHVSPGRKIQRRGIGFDHAHGFDRIGRCDRGSQFVELAQIVTKPNENPALPVELSRDQLARDRKV
jgi:hypothetical protein